MWRLFLKLCNRHYKTPQVMQFALHFLMIIASLVATKQDNILRNHIFCSMSVFQLFSMKSRLYTGFRII